MPPLPLRNILDRTTAEKGLPAAIEQYRELRSANYGTAAYDFGDPAGGAAGVGGNGLLGYATQLFFRDRLEEEAVVRLRLVLLRDADAEQPETGRQAEAAAELAAECGIDVTDLRPEGAGVLERLASLVCLVDFAAVYLALALGVDATRAPVLHEPGRR